MLQEMIDLRPLSANIPGKAKECATKSGICKRDIFPNELVLEDATEKNDKESTTLVRLRVVI